VSGFMKRKIALIGGDMRNVKLAEFLSMENEIKTYGLEKNKELSKNSDIQMENNLQMAVSDAELIICPIPFSRDGKRVYSPLSNNEINILELLKKAKFKRIVAGSISKEFIETAKKNNVELTDIMKCENLTVYNTIATAEGAIKIAIEKTQINIHGSKVLILGFGRVAKTTAEKFSALNADVTCAARKEEDFAWMEVYGYKNVNINKLDENLSQYDIIINTVPTVILTKDRLKHISKDSLIIDLASKPGGIDFATAEKFELNYEWALALPGKISPLTSAEYIKRIIDKI